MTRKSLRILSFGVLAGAALAVASQGITLRRTLAPNTTDTYKSVATMTQNLEVPGMGEQEVTMDSESTMTFKLGKVDAEKNAAEVEFTIKVDKSSVGGSMVATAQEPPKVEPITVKALLDHRNRFQVTERPKTDAANAAMMSNMDSLSAGMFYEFPEKAVSVGDTWEILIPKNPVFGNKEQKLTVKWVGEKVVDGKSYYHMTMRGKLEMDMEMNQEAGGMPMKMHITGTFNMNSEGLVEKETGRTFRNTVKGDFDNKVKVVEQGMEIPVKGKTSMVMTLVPNS